MALKILSTILLSVLFVFSVADKKEYPFLCAIVAAIFFGLPIITIWVT